MTWHPISTAPKDGTVIWAAIKRSIPNRPDVKIAGKQMPLSHPGVYRADGLKWDLGWNVALPVGYGGIPDEWIAGWVHLPPPPHESDQP